MENITKSPILLVIDDEADIVEIVQELAKNAGFRTLSASSVDLALDLFNTHPIAAVVTDFMMPEKSGDFFIRNVRKQGFLGPIVMITASTTMTDKIAKDLGVDFLLRKPAFHEALIHLLKNPKFL